MSIKSICSISIIICLMNTALSGMDRYDAFMQFKAELYNQPDEQHIQEALAAYKKELDTAVLSEEEQLTLSNLFTLEQTVFEKKNGVPLTAKQRYKLLIHQNQLSKKFMSGKKYHTVHPWFLVSWADIKSRLTSFISGQTKYEEANTARRLYGEALKKDRKCSPAALSFGLWLFFAPPLAGGGYDAALDMFSNAVSYAKTDYEKYLALIYRSQVYVELAQTASADADLKAAAAILPNEIFTKKIIEGNKNGVLFFKNK